MTFFIEHEIVLKPNAKPVRKAPRRLSPKILEVAQEEIDKMLREDIIETSKSDWCSRPVIVKKSDGSYRFCIGYRDLNKVTEEDAYPMKNVDTILDKLRKAKYIFQIDLKQAFMQILVAEASRKYTAFGVQGKGLYQFKRMPFGLVNSPKTFVRLIDALFGLEYDPNVFAYLDDLIIISEDFESHLGLLEKVLKTLVEAGLKINKDKCEFACTSVTYLGYLFNKDGLRPDPERKNQSWICQAPLTLKNSDGCCECSDGIRGLLKMKPRKKFL